MTIIFISMGAAAFIAILIRFASKRIVQASPAETHSGFDA